MRWSTDKVEQIISGVVPGHEIIHGEPGGDVDTNSLTLVYGDGKEDNWDNDAIMVYGFQADNSDYEALMKADKDDMDITAVVVRNRFSDSDGGIQTTDEQIAVDGAKIQAALRRAGFSVVGSLDDYF